MLIEASVLLGGPIVVIYLLVRLVTKTWKRWWEELATCAMIVYSAFMIYALWLEPGYVRETLSYNVIPFYTVYSYMNELAIGFIPFPIIIMNLVGNIVVTIPIGFWLVFKRKSNKVALVVAGIVPLLFELGQLLLHVIGYATRVVDIDDWLLNGLGILLGYYSLTWLARFRQQKQKCKGEYEDESPAKEFI